MQDAQLVAIKDGWAALGEGWAVFGRSREEAMDRFQAAEEKHAELRARPQRSAATERARASDPSAAGGIATAITEDSY